jgi:hypothetical protein
MRNLLNKFKNFKIFSSLIFFSILVLSCSEEKIKEETISPPPETISKKTIKGCKGCHSHRLAEHHPQNCEHCHNGDPEASEAQAAHINKSSYPAHPALMTKNCGKCHPDKVKNIQTSAHFTLKNEINQVLTSFGAARPLNSLLEIPAHDSPSTPIELAEDLLRRRCLRCHPYTSGDSYLNVFRGSGCAACHLKFKNGYIEDHTFLRYPDDDQCLHCHYGNRVGADYYGRHEHDFNWEYRTPYQAGGLTPRPYGVEYHQLSPDIHQQKGIACIDCHPGSQLMAAGHWKEKSNIKKPAPSPAGSEISCLSCHGWSPGKPIPLENIEIQGNNLLLTGKISKKQLLIPMLKNKAHQENKNKAACTVCHARWSYNDRGTHLMRYDSDDFDPWSYLSIQDSFEVEQFLEAVYNSDEEPPPVMSDKLTNQDKPGIWFKGYELRRWEDMIIQKDENGILQVFRPVLDLHLSFVNQDDEVIFDSIKGQKKLLPYTPHTIGKAGVFYRQRLKE